ncbi:NAD-dependent epimerase/dehydratase family protein [bacterium]|nr:NAD-dependent epimerase/dehydratase family protein [bacterium]
MREESVFFEGRTVLVTGATGLIGSHAIEALLARGARVVGTLHRSPPVVVDPRIEYRKVDLATREGCEAAAKGCDTVVFSAANTSGAFVMRTNPVAHVTENLLINSQLLEAAWRAKVERVAFVSTTTVYPAVPHAVREDEAFTGDPHPVYFGVGWMKRYIEKLCAFYEQKFGLKVAILRPTNVYGPRDKFDFERGHVLPALYIDDMTDALLGAIEKCADGDAINIGSGQPVTIREAVELVLRLTGRAGARVVYDPSKPTSIPTRTIDLAKARARLGYRPRVSFEEGLKRTIEWYRQNPAR